jgi:hypothetical protein
MLPTDELTVTLKAAQWEQVLGLLNDVAAPARVTLPLIQSIQSQCLSNSAQNQPLNADALRRANALNGNDVGEQGVLPPPIN